MAMDPSLGIDRYLLRILYVEKKGSKEVIKMASLRILIADDQIPPDDVSEETFREQLLTTYGDNQQTRGFLEQCLFMNTIIQSLRDFGYHVTPARTFATAEKEITKTSFDLAIIDLGWYMDATIPQTERATAGWALCNKLDDIDVKKGRRTPQILFSSRFPDQPELSREAAKRQKLPVFKEPTANVRNSIMAAVGFVEATLATQQGNSKSADSYTQELRNISLSFFKEPLRDYRQWAVFTMIFVALSLLILITSITLVIFGVIKVQVATLSSIASIVSGIISTLLYRRLSQTQKTVESTRTDLLKQIGT